MSRPVRADLDAFAAFVHAVEATGASFAMGPWWGNAPHNGLRLVDGGAPWRWPLCTNPESEGDTSLTYSALGIGTGATRLGWLRPQCIPSNSTHWPARMQNDVCFGVFLPDCADLLPIVATGAVGVDDTFVVYPYVQHPTTSHGCVGVRVNSGTTLYFPAPCEPGVLLVQRRGSDIVECWLNGLYLGAQSQAVGALSTNGIRFFRQISDATIGRRYFALAFFIDGSLTGTAGVGQTEVGSQVATITAAMNTLVAYGRGRNISTNWHPLADPYFEMMKDLGAEPSTTWQSWYNTVIQSFDTDGYLASLDGMFILHGHDVNVGLLNILRPRSIATITGGTGSIDFVAKSGSRATTNSIATGIVPSSGNGTIGAKLQPNSHMLIWRGDILGQSGGPAFGSQELMILPRFTSTPNNIAFRSASGTTEFLLPTASPLSGVHSVSLDRVGAGARQIYVDGAADGPTTSLATADFSVTNQLRIFTRSGSGSPALDTVQRHRWAISGAGLGDAAQLAIHNRLASLDALLPA